MTGSVKARFFRLGFKLASRFLWRGRLKTIKTEDHSVAGRFTVRCYHPEGKARGPVILYFHGGGFVIGDIDAYDGLCRDLCSRSGYTVVSVDYRRAPEHRFPVAVEDCLLALDWLIQNAQSLGLTTEALYVAGDSAGGNLAAVTALEAKARYSGVIRGQILIYPVTAHYTAGFSSYDECGKGYLLTRKQMLWFWDTYLGGGYSQSYSDPLATPLLREDLEGLPPTLLITAELDPLRDEGRAYAKKMLNAGVAVRHAEYEGCQHGFIGIAGPTVDHSRALDDIVAWLRHLEL